MAINSLACLTPSKLKLSPLSLISKLSLSSLQSHTQNDDITPKERAIVSLFHHCSTVNHLTQLHAHIIQSGFLHNVFVTAKIIQFCAVSPHISMDYAERVFGEIEFLDGYLWNTTIRGFGNDNNPEKAFEYYKRMRKKGKNPDSFTFCFLLKICGKFGFLILGKELHCESVKHGCEKQGFVRNTLIHMYGSLREIEIARKVFDELPSLDLVAWNAIIDCYVSRGLYKEALDLYMKMVQKGVQPDEATISVILSACSAMGNLDFGKWVHSYVRSGGVNDVIIVCNSLIDMYAKCGVIGEAYEIFDKMGRKNITSWNVMILGLAMNGLENEALRLFTRMVDEKHEVPDNVTFLGVLCACSHGGLVEEGRRFFERMSSEYGIQPTIKHYGCMVDLLGRAGLIEEAYDLIEGMPMQGNAIVWRTLMGACRVHGNVALGERVRQRILQLEYHSSDYVLLSNMYGSVGHWNELARVRRSMRNRRISKPMPANSSIGMQLSAVYAEDVVAADPTLVI